jgi:hypothetical protein
VLLAAFLAGDRADRVLRRKARALFADREVPGKQVLVILHLGDLVDFLQNGLLRDLQDLDFAGLVVVDRDRNEKLQVDGARAATAFACFKVAQLHRDVLGGGLLLEAEGLGLAGALAPDFVALQGLVREQCEAD